eukprot:gene10373-12265_t
MRVATGFVGLLVTRQLSLLFVKARRMYTKNMEAQDAARQLLQAWISRKWIQTKLEYPLVSNIEQVYAIHAAMTKSPLAQKLGGHAGYKQGGVGAVQGQECVYGVLFGRGILDEREWTGYTSISRSEFNLFGLEAEVGFLLGEDLPPRRRGYSEAEVFSAVSEIVLCIECTGTRHTLNGLTSLERLADCCCGAGVIMGPRFYPSHVAGDMGLEASQLDGLVARIFVSGQEKCSGATTGNPCGSPTASLAWCANHLNKRGLGLRSGQLVIAGAICKTSDFTDNEDIRVVFEGLGEARARIRA